MRAEEVRHRVGVQHDQDGKAQHETDYREETCTNVVFSDFVGTGHSSTPLSDICGVWQRTVDMASGIRSALDEILVGGVSLDGFEQLLDLNRWCHGDEAASKCCHCLEFPLAHQEIFLAGTAGSKVDGGEEAFLGNRSVKDQLHVPGALELLEDHLVRPRPGVDEAGGDDGQASAFLRTFVHAPNICLGTSSALASSPPDIVRPLEAYFFESC